MRNFFSIVFIAGFALFGRVMQQHLGSNITILVSAPSVSGNDSLFIAGNFNSWQPSSTPLEFDSAAGKWKVTINDFIGGSFSYKITRGSWDKVECAVDGGEIDNNTIAVAKDTVFSYQVKDWQDEFDTKSKMSTASPQVHILSKKFKISVDGEQRTIRMYIPKGYEKTSKRYPVIYMHDGQNLFDDQTAFSGEWGIDEIMDSLIAKKKKACIIVGIDNGPKRIQEYNPFTNEKYGEGEGDAYLEFIVNELKPYIDKNYRTHSDRKNTMIAGSSLGGLISYYAALKYPKVFGKAGVFSPSFWIAPELSELTAKLAKGNSTKFFFSMGVAEGQNYVTDMNQMVEKYATYSKGIMYSYIPEQGMHNEKSWHDAFLHFYPWITASGANVILKVK